MLMSIDCRMESSCERGGKKGLVQLHSWALMGCVAFEIPNAVWHSRRHLLLGRLLHAVFISWLFFTCVSRIEEHQVR